MPFFVVAALPKSRPLGPVTSPCPQCKGGRTLERRWHAFYFFVLPLFAMRNRLVAVCRACKTLETWTGPVPADDAPLPLLHRLGWLIPAVVGAAFLAALAHPSP